MKRVALAITAWCASAAAAPPDVRVTVDAADNLADTAHPIPTLGIFNDSKQPIEIEMFNGVPFTTLEVKDASGNFPRAEGAKCGNGFVPHVIAPGQAEFFPLWVRVEHGPGASGTYRTVLPYVVVRGTKRATAEATSDPYVLAYGDVAPRDPATKPGAVVIVSAEREHNSPVAEPSPSALAARLLPDAAACVATAQKRLPWLRGQFTLWVYQYKDPKPTLFLDSSLLGDRAVNACLGAITVHDRVPTKLEITYAVSPPL